MGLTSSPTSPCLFMGTLIDGEPPIYVGIYVDDIIYFSTSATVEQRFETLLSKLGQVDFMGTVSLFLGIIGLIMRMDIFLCILHNNPL
ncbi:MAG: hypothetical protein ACK53Y_11525, partial [bacterium]